MHGELTEDVKIEVLGRSVTATFMPTEVKTFRLPESSDPVEVDLIERNR
jgi:hypothetical protein